MQVLGPRFERSSLDYHLPSDRFCRLMKPDNPIGCSARIWVERLRQAVSLSHSTMKKGKSDGDHQHRN